MVVLRRTAYEPRSGAVYEVHDGLHPLFRVRVARARGVVREERILYPSTDWSGAAARPQIEVCLSGLVRNDQDQDVRWLRAGQFTVGRSLGAFWSRQEGDGLVLCLDWSLGTLGSLAPDGLPVGELSRPSHGRLEALAEVIADASTTAATIARTVPEVVALLREAGAPLDPIDPRDLGAEIHPEDARIADALTHAMSNLAAAPMAVDLEQSLRRSRRQVTESVTRFALRYGLNGEDWRSLRDRWRLTAAAVLATHPKAQTEAIATAVGYGSSRALCTAFARAGLPSPGAMRRAVEELRGTPHFDG
jgi:AraC-like DNA-binding protein